VSWNYEKDLDERAVKYLARVREETQRMGTLIDDLLELSRVSRSEMRRERVDLSALAGRVAGQLRETYRDRDISFDIEAGLGATGDERLLEIALTNLLSNAVKFTGNRGEARIEFTSAERGRGHGFEVRDNGAGFDPRHKDVLFAPFQRLHRTTDFPGTGIGLATVKRVIHRHGGDVWAKAELNCGATFGFSLAADDDAPTKEK
jgi:signal transduction histidine kinase